MKLKSTFFTTTLLLLLFTLPACKKDVAKETAEFEQEMAKALGSSVFPITNVSAMHGLNFEAGFLILCDKALYEKHPDFLIPKDSHPAKLAEKLACKKLQKDSIFSPAFFVMNPPKSSTGQTVTSVSFALKDFRTKQNIDIGKFNLSTNGDLYPKNRHVLLPKFADIPANALPTSVVNEGKITFVATFTDKVENREFFVEQSIEFAG